MKPILNLEEQSLNIYDYGIVPNTKNMPGIPARVTAVHKERYEIVCEYGIAYARLKTKEYFVDTQDFPTTGDFVMVDYVSSGDSRILATLPRKTVFTRREPGCAIRAAIESGELDMGRWESYQKLSEEAVDKAEMLRRKNEWSKGVAKFTKQRNKEIW